MTSRQFQLWCDRVESLDHAVSALGLHARRDDVLWLFRYLGYNIKSVIFDTGLEYQATWKHVKYMQDLGFDIEIIKPVKNIPNTVYHYGQPFLSKYVSDMIQRLQYNHFDFRNDGWLEFEEAYLKYPHCKSVLYWWNNKNKSRSKNISWNRALKEFLIENDGLPFPTSAHCCYNTKKLPSKQYARKNNVDLLMMGIRKAEGGTRATAYPSCFISNSVIYPYSLYLPLFWWKNEDKEMFDQELGIKHSDCYDVYGMRRTGCPACPFGKHYIEEIDSISKFEPKLSKAVINIFGDAYDWTNKYREYQKEHKVKGYYSSALIEEREKVRQERLSETYENE